MSGLNPYTGTWGRRQVVHLLKRTLYGAKPADVEYFLGKTITQSVDELLTLPGSAPAPPLNYYEGLDNSGTPMKDADNVPKGSTWVNGTYGDGTTNFFRGESLKAWWISNLVNQGRSIQEKMMVFWSDHFVTELKAGGGATAAYRLIELFRTHTFSPLRTLMIEVSKNPQMLHYLNGYLNTKFSPDENYGRELQELFGVGKGSGSQYTENDVKEAARILTGHSLDWNAQTYKFFDTLHDTGDKTFSAFYGNKVITGKSGSAGAGELDELVDMILATDECAKFICRKIYRYFVYHEIDATVETNIIEPLATIYRNNSYNLKPVLDKLLKSEHFYDASVVGAQIKTPLDLVVGFARENSITPPSAPLETVYRFYLDLYYTAYIQAQALGDPPNVAGWPAFYQGPQYYQIWINSDTLPKRINYTNYMLYGGYNNSFDPVKAAAQFSNVADPNQFLSDLLGDMYLIDILSTTVFLIKKQILLSGQSSDSYWSDAWNDYINNPGDTTKKQVVSTRLQNLYVYLTQSPHYQIF
ncbi:MAG: DUF1800 domain-containing protein [Bacteroidetes bacterium]|nr:DUF1800 domain-containing protein [Bacteroidota bacterium]